MNIENGSLSIHPSFDFLQLGVRSLANASRARQFNRQNPPGVGWVNFFKMRVYPHMRAKFGRGTSRNICNNR